MTRKIYLIYYLAVCLFIPGSVSAQIYPDQHYMWRTDSIYANIESSNGIKLSSDGKSIELEENAVSGYMILKTQYSSQPFNHGLPSWNGSAPTASSSFKIQMRFKYGTGVSPWLTVGYWKSNIWSSYGTTSYGGGFIDYDYVKLNSYNSEWQFMVTMTRSSAQVPSPTINKLSFFVSDSRTTNSINYNAILNDKPAAIFIPTDFVYQYGVDPQIGGSICSPTTVSMILKSYSISVDPYQFALSTYDPYYKMFGIWPRVVQNASEYGLDGAVTRYRTWSETYEVLASGGRIGMSIGAPLYTGHLIMLAGFTSNGDPIVHDPAKSQGYSYVYNKSDLSHSWFDKGGVAYTFYPAGTPVSAEESGNGIIAADFELYQNYPNPFNPSTVISYAIPQDGFVHLVILDLLGQEIATLVSGYQVSGNHQIIFNAGNLSSGMYLYRLQAGSFTSTKKMLLVR